MRLICLLGLPWSVAKVLVSIGNAGLHHLHPHIVPPVVSQLAGPLKVGGVGHISIHKLLHNVTGMHVQSDQSTQGQSVLQHTTTVSRYENTRHRVLHHHCAQPSGAADH